MSDVSATTDRDATHPRTPIRFLGQYQDSETSLHYNLYRYFDPDAGAYINADPIRLLGGTNAYAYAANPFSRTDPRGLHVATAQFADGRRRRMIR